MVRRLAAAPLLGAFDAFLPIHAAWWALFGVPLLAILHGAVGFLAMFPVTLAVGPFGLAIVATTLLVRLVLLPLAAYRSARPCGPGVRPPPSRSASAPPSPSCAGAIAAARWSSSRRSWS